MRVPDTKENENKCICENCPTYNDCTKEKKVKFFCFRGKTECDMDRQGCICGECPIASQYQLRDLYFCDTDAANGKYET